MDLGVLKGTGAGVAEADLIKTSTTAGFAKDVLEASRLHILRELVQRIVLGNLLFDDIKPAQPLGLVFPCPQTGIAIPQPFYFRARLPGGNRRLDRGSQAFGEGSLHSAHDLSFLLCVLLNRCE